MRTITFDGYGVLTVPNPVAFIFSPQAVRFQEEGRHVESIEITVSNYRSGDSIRETKVKYPTYSEPVCFDVSRMMQLVSRERTSDILKHVKYGLDLVNSLLQEFEIEVYAKFTDGSTLSHDVIVYGFLGALDGAESYNLGKKVRRLFVNFPQTITMWDASEAPLIFREFNSDFNNDYNAVVTLPPMDDVEEFSHKSAEVSPLRLLQRDNPTFYERLMNGETVTGSQGIWYAEQDGQSQQATVEPITFVPDLRTTGTYLRWLDRRGSVGYWLFENSKMNTSVGVKSSFERFVDDPTIPDRGVLPNPSFVDYRETRTMTIGSNDVSSEDYEYLCSLASSPVVEMLVKNDPINPQWMRVNVAAGSYARNIRRSTPSTQEFELTIILPERNTITL